MQNPWVFRTWIILVSIVILGSALLPGFVLSYDMVWVPDYSITRTDVWGLGDSLPRAVPSDAVVALLDLVLPAPLVQKAILLATLIAAGFGIGKLVGDESQIAKFAAATFFLWNPFVAERLAIGHWPVLIGYAAIPWLIYGLQDPSRRLSRVLALAATAISPATGVAGVLTILVAATGVIANRMKWLVFAGALNAPWIVAGLLHPTMGITDTRAVEFFAAQDSGYLGTFASVLSLGGIWNSDVHLGSRELLIAWVWVVLLLSIMIFGLANAWERHKKLLTQLSILGFVGFLIALFGWITPNALGWLIETVPGAGLIRDGTRMLLLLAPLQAVAFGFGVAAIVQKAPNWRPIFAVGLTLVPILAIPDLAWGVGGQLRGVDYPDSWLESRSAVSNYTGQGDILVIPFESYRAPKWNEGRPVLDPSGRFYDRNTVVNDDLYVSGQLIPGENPRAKEIQEILQTSDPASRLSAVGIAIVVADNAEAAQSINGERLYESADRIVIALDGPVAVEDPDKFRTWLMIAAWLAPALAKILGTVFAIIRRNGQFLGRKRI